MLCPLFATDMHTVTEHLPFSPLPFRFSDARQSRRLAITDRVCDLQRWRKVAVSNRRRCSPAAHRSHSARVQDTTRDEHVAHARAAACQHGRCDGLGQFASPIEARCKGPSEVAMPQWLYAQNIWIAWVAWRSVQASAGPSPRASNGVIARAKAPPPPTGRPASTSRATRQLNSRDPSRRRAWQNRPFQILV